MKRSRDEAEVIIRLDYKEQKAHICVCQWPAMAAKMARRYGPSLDPGGTLSERWVVPLKAISFRSPEKKARKATIARRTHILASGARTTSSFSHSTRATKPEPPPDGCLGAENANFAPSFPLGFRPIAATEKAPDSASVFKN